MSLAGIQQGIRSAEHLCTRQLAFRSELDAADAERCEILESRFTSPARRIMLEASNQNADFGHEYFKVVRNPIEPGLSETTAYELNMRRHASPFGSPAEGSLEAARWDSVLLLLGKVKMG
jgi:hypothetical protein